MAVRANNALNGTSLSHLTNSHVVSPRTSTSHYLLWRPGICVGCMGRVVVLGTCAGYLQAHQVSYPISSRRAQKARRAASLSGSSSPGMGLSFDAALFILGGTATSPRFPSWVWAANALPQPSTGAEWDSAG